MSTNKEIVTSLAAKYLSGVATPDEVIQLHESIKDPVIRSEFEKLSKLWYHSSPKHIHKTVPVEEAWKEFQLLVEEKKNKPRRKIPVYKYVIAASIAGIITLAAWLYFRTDPAEPMISHQISNTISTDTLTDGSTAVLNINSKLSYSPGFKNHLRSVLFNGEGFFNVVPDKNKPFEIQVDDVTIKVIGTSFNVHEIKNEEIQVQVVSGIVEMYTDDNSVLIRKGQTGTYKFVNKKLLVENKIDVNSFAYATKEFAFNDVPFSTACNYLEKAFNVTVKLEPGIFEECRISSEFENKSLPYILEVLCNTLNASYTREKNVIYIKGKTKSKACV